MTVGPSGSSLRLSRVTWLCLAAAVCALILPATGSAHHTITYALVGTAGQNGWHRSDVTIQWSITQPGDITSTTGCEPGQRVTTEGPTSHTCSATAADHTVSVTVALKIDKTLPTVPAGTAARSPDSNGWYNHAVAVGFTATDTVSGLDFCTGGSYGGPDSASASVPGSCTDRAGNTSSGGFPLSYDSTAPTPTAAASRAPNGNGWYRAPLTIAFAQAPGDLSGPGTCSAPVDYSGPDSGAASVPGTCTDRAGNPSGSVAHVFKYDATAPTAVASADRPPNANGWYRSSLRISFAQAQGDLSGPDTCSAPVDYAGPDSTSVTRSGTCTDRAGNTSAAGGLIVRYDATAPTATGALARPPNGNGWYRAPVALDVTGTDGLSGIASCSGATYSGPDGASGPCPVPAQTAPGTRRRRPRR